MVSNAARLSPQMPLLDEAPSPGLYLVKGDEPDIFDDEDLPEPSLLEVLESGITPRFLPEMITDDVIDFHDYQQDAIAEILNGFLHEGLRSQRLVLPTGCGKTITFNGIAKYFSAMKLRTLVLVHRKELLRQADEKMQKVGMLPLLEQGDLRALPHFGGKHRVVVASVQSLHKDRVTLWPRDAFDLIISDECHHIRFDKRNHWAKVLQYFHTAFRLGVTATPGITVKGTYMPLPGWQKTIEPITLMEAIKRGALCPLKFKRIKTDIDLRSVGQVFGEDGDFKQNELDEVIYRNTNKLASAIKENIGSRRTVVFTPLVASAEALCKALNDIDVKAAFVSGETKDPEAIYDAHERKEFQVLVNCMKLTEGYDAPYLECVVLARPTKSINLYRQCVGRGTRTSPQTGKTDCLILDFAWVTGKLPLVSPAQLTQDRMSESFSVEAAESVSELFGTMDDLIEREDVDGIEFFKLLDEAQQTLEERQEKERIRQEIEERKAAELEARRKKNKEERFRYEVENIDPFAASLLGVTGLQMDKWSKGEQASEKQCELITKLSKGKIKTEGLTKKAASGIIGQLMADREAGLSSFAQRNVLTSKLGKNNLTPEQARRMTFEEASAYISQHKQW